VWLSACAKFLLTSAMMQAARSMIGIGRPKKKPWT
jgi:hypothetical protein